MHYFSHILPNGLRMVHLPMESPVSYCGFAVNAWKPGLKNRTNLVWLILWSI